MNPLVEAALYLVVPWLATYAAIRGIRARHVTRRRR